MHSDGAERRESLKEEKHTRCVRRRVASQGSIVVFNHGIASDVLGVVKAREHGVHGRGQDGVVGTGAANGARGSGRGRRQGRGCRLHVHGKVGLEHDGGLAVAGNRDGARRGRQHVVHGRAGERRLLLLGHEHGLLVLRRGRAGARVGGRQRHGVVVAGRAGLLLLLLDVHLLGEKVAVAASVGLLGVVEEVGAHGSHGHDGIHCSLVVSDGQACDGRTARRQRPRLTKY